MAIQSITMQDEESGDRECHYASTAEEALQIYEDLYKQHTSSGDGRGSMAPVSSVNNSRWIGSEALRKVYSWFIIIETTIGP